MHETFKKEKSKSCLLTGSSFPAAEISRAFVFFSSFLYLLGKFLKKNSSRNEIKCKAFKAPEVILGNLEL